MKRISLFFMMVLCIMISSQAVYASDSIKVMVDGKPLGFEVPPMTINGRVLVPMRKIFEILGAEVTWDSRSNMITGTKQDIHIALKPGESKAVVNGAELNLDVPATIINNRTLVPARFISESLGATVSWDQATQTVVIRTKGIDTGVSLFDPSSADKSELDSPLYDLIKLSLLNHETKIDLSDYMVNIKSSEEAFDTMYRVLDEHPEIFYLSDKPSTYWTNGILEISYAYGEDAIESMKKDMDAKVNGLVSELIHSGMSDFDKEKAIHDYLVLNTEYDQNNKERNTLPLESHSAYGVLLKGAGVCDGYAKAAKILLDRAGIKTRLISGSATDSGKNSEDHMWNLVWLEGEAYHLDVTWDDPAPDQIGEVHYGYFNVTDEDISKTHAWDRSKYTETCSAVKYNYFYSNNLVVNGEDDFYKLLSDKIHLQEKSIMIRMIEFDPMIDPWEMVKRINRDDGYRNYVKSASLSNIERMGIYEINDIEYE